MRTTLTIDNDLLREAKVIAAKRGDSLKKVVEQGIREVIRMEQDRADQEHRPPLVIHKTGGLMPGINLDKTSELLDLMDEWDEADRRQRADLRGPQ